MKNSSLVHAVWFLAAAGAFAGGWFFKPSDSASASAGRDRSAPREAPAPASGKTAAQSAAAIAAAKAAGIDDSDAWLSKFLVGKDGTIPADRMVVAVQDAIRETDPMKSMIYFAKLMQHLTPENAADAFNTVKTSVAGFEAMRYLPMLTYSWGGVDGAKALAAMKEMGGRESMMGSAGAIAGWAAKDPAAAKEYVAANKSEDNGWMNNIMNRSLVNGLLRNSPEEAMAFISSVPADQQSELIGVVAEDKIKLGREAATDWANSLTDPKMKASAMERIAGQEARQNPAQAAEWISKFAGEEWAKDSVGTIAREYAQKDPKAALAWANTLPAGDTQNTAYRDQFREWGRSDPTAASEALNAMPAGLGRDNAIASFSRSIMRENPQDAQTWVRSIADTGVRKETILDMVRRMPAAEAQAFAGADVTPQEIQEAQANRGGDRGDRGGPPWMGGGGPGGGFRRGGPGF